MSAKDLILEIDQRPESDLEVKRARTKAIWNIANVVRQDNPPLYFGMIDAEIIGVRLKISTKMATMMVTCRRWMSDVSVEVSRQPLG